MLHTHLVVNFAKTGLTRPGTNDVSTFYIPQTSDVVAVAPLSNKLKLFKIFKNYYYFLNFIYFSILRSVAHASAAGGGASSQQRQQAADYVLRTSSILCRM
jgi:hypothetical protein